jgi:hypothetical protein
LEKLRGLSAKCQKLEFPGIVFLKENLWTKSTSSWTAPARSTVDQRPLPRSGAHRSSASGRSGARELRPRGGGGERRAGEFNDGVAAAREVVERRLTGGGALARKGNGKGALRAKRRSVGGVRVCTEGGAAFYRAEARQEARVPSVAGVEGASMSWLEGVGYWRSEQVRVSFNGEMKEGQRGEFSPSAEVAMGATRGQTATEDAGSILVREEEESRLGQASQKAEWAGWAENQEGNSF